MNSTPETLPERRLRAAREVVRIGLVVSLAAVAPWLALERGRLLLPALGLATMDVALGVLRRRAGVAALLRLRYVALGPVVLATLAFAGAPGEAVVLALAWTGLCLLSLRALRAALPLLAAAPLLALTPPPDLRAHGEVLRVATYNLEWARGGPLDLVATIAELKPDVVALQELVSERCGMPLDLIAQLRAGTGMEGVAVLEPHERHGPFGTGVLSRWPIESFDSLRLPYVSGAGSQRVATRARICVRGRRITVVSAHLDRPPYASIEDNLRQTRALARWLEGEDSIVLCGDFNAFPVYPSYDLLRHEFVEVRRSQRWPSGSWPNPLGAVRLDWMFVRGLDPISQRVVRKGSSDHFPVLAELALPPVEPTPAGGVSTSPR